MEVDHFDFRQKKDLVQRYENLLLATRHCNGAKQQKPTPRERAAGLRLLNPCEEWDYGKHIFEDPVTHLLVGVTPEGIYHIRTCDLNADHLVVERRDRAEIWMVLKRSIFTTKETMSSTNALDLVRALRGQVEKMIPELPLLNSERKVACDLSK